MVNKGPEMITVWRKGSWRYRYILICFAVATGLFLHRHSGGSFSSLVPMGNLPATVPVPLANTLSKHSQIFLDTAHALEVSPAPSLPLLSINDYDFNGPFVGWPLQRVCAESTFTPGLIFVCDNNSGGIGNIRNFILTCVRYAIDAGASGLILPKIQRRSESELSNIMTSILQPFDYFFDEEHFRFVFNTYCPQITIHTELEDVPHTEARSDLKEFYPKELNKDTDGCDGRGVNRHLDQFRMKFDPWVERTAGHIPSVELPVTVRFRWAAFFEWPIYRDGPEFAATFGDILRIRKDVHELAALTLVEMSRYVGVTPDRRRQAFNAPFLGVHLRTEADALDFWPDFTQQSDGYIEQAKIRGLSYAYLAGGNATEGHRFAEKAAQAIGLNVTSKLELLKGHDLKRLTALSWDQQALVDFLVLQKSTYFTGCSFSSFTMNIAFKRHLMTDGLLTRQWKSPGDVYSTMIGRFESWFEDWVFMFECMWP